MFTRCLKQMTITTMIYVSCTKSLPVSHIPLIKIAVLLDFQYNFSQTVLKQSWNIRPGDEVSHLTDTHTYFLPFTRLQINFKCKSIALMCMYVLHKLMTSFIRYQTKTEFTENTFLWIWRDTWILLRKSKQLLALLINSAVCWPDCL